VIERADLFARIGADLTAHLKEEEAVFFPAVERAEAATTSGLEPEAGDRATIRASLERLHREHEEVGEAVHTIRHLARDYAVPSDACPAFVVTYQKLKEFEDDLHKPVHLENNILFPRAVEL
jgi:regulator of cell morphogenesis and NO signaling